MRILVSAECFGYGPITTVLNIVKYLKQYKNVCLDFIGSGISLEQAKLSNYFDKYYICNTYDKNDLERCKSIIKQYDIFLSSENIEGAVFAVKNNIKKVYYADNLMWMWDKLPEELNKVSKFFISEIIPVQENLERIGKNIKNPLIVGPIREIDVGEKSLENQLMINIGGASSFLLDNNIITNFYNKLFNEILLNQNLERFSRIIVCGGSEVIDKLVLPKTNLNIIKRTLSNEEYTNEMKKSTHCIIASGLGNFIETIGLQKNIMILPPINYSQLLQIDYYEKSNFGFEIITWSKFDFYKEIPKYLDEDTGVNLVVQNIKNYLKNDYSNLVNEALNKFLNEKQDKYFEIRNNYIGNLKKDASKIIAKIIYDENRGD